MNESSHINVDWISPPGDTIEDLLEEQGWKQTDLARRMDVTPQFVNELIKGKTAISTKTAQGLSQVLGSTPDFWLVRDAKYQAGLQHLRAAKDAEAAAEWLKELPLPWMTQHGLVRDIRKKGELVLDALSFFGVASVDAWREQYIQPLTAFRASGKFEKKLGAVVAWLREGERQASKIPCQKFDESAFRTALRDLRSLTNETDPKVFIPRMTELCAACGVAVVFLDAPKGCPVSGATKWVQPGKALLMLSLRHKSNDQLWFSFFHEAAHLILHGRKLTFIEGLDGLDSEEETEANTYAGNILIKPADMNRLGRLAANRFMSKNDVCNFASEIGIPPGIVVGRIHKEGLRDWSYMNDLKIFYAWTKDDNGNGQSS